jgi:hypothetical protein
MSLESMRAEGAVEPTKLENNTVTWRGSAAVSLASAATVADVPRGARVKSLPDHNSVIPLRWRTAGHAQIFQVFRRHLRQNRLVHRVVAEGGLILLRSQLATSMTEPAPAKVFT